MNKAMIIAACLVIAAVVMLPASAQSNRLGEPHFPPSGVPGLGPAQVNPGIGPVQLQPDMGPVWRPLNPWDQPGLPGQDIGPLDPPMANPFGPPNPQPPFQDLFRQAPPLDRLQIEKTRKDQKEFVEAGSIAHLMAHGFVHTFKPVSVSEFRPTNVRWARPGGGGLLAGIGAAIAGLFGALFGRKKNETRV